MSGAKSACPLLGMDQIALLSYGQPGGESSSRRVTLTAVTLRSCVLLTQVADMLHHCKISDVDLRFLFPVMLRDDRLADMRRHPTVRTQLPSISWQGRLTSVQPRIRLTRSFDQRSHSYLGYALWVSGVMGDEEREFSIGVGKVAQAKHAFRVTDIVCGESRPVLDRRLESVEFYKTSKLRLIERSGERHHKPPPWLDVPPDLQVYRQRGHRRLDARTYEAKCRSCMWGCRMAVDMIIDHWRPDKRRYRFETFCYGPKSCPWYRPGPNRKVPGRRGMTWKEEDWVDEEATSHRSMDE